MKADTLSAGADALAVTAEQALTRRFLLDYPHEAARLLETLPTAEAADVLAAQAPHAALRAWQALASDVALAVLDELPGPLASHLLAEAEPQVAVAVLARLDASPREAWLQRLGGEAAHELRELLAYPPDSAGHLMDPRVSALHSGMRVADAIERLRQIRRNGLRELFVVDDNGRLAGRVEVQDLALAARELPLADITRGVVAFVSALDPREDVVQTLQKHPISALPVVNVSGRFIGVIRQAELMAAVEEESSLDMLTMVGASPDERALSTPGFAVRKRLPWL
jgi:magnesium transporter